MKGNKPLEVLAELFAGFTGKMPVSVIPLATGSGSKRRYYRMKAEGVSLIGAFNENPAENSAFIYLSEHFLVHGLPVPRVLATDPGGNCYLQEDLGDTSLYGMIGDDPTAAEPWLEEALKALVQFQVPASVDLDFSRCYPQPAFDRQAALWDLHYFKYMFLKLSGAEMDEERLEKEFKTLLDLLFRDFTTGFMYRDFQSRNIMVRDKRLWFIDFQGGRKGPLAYDVASLLYQSRIALPEEVRVRLIGVYCDALNKAIQVDEKAFAGQVRGFAILRLLQTLGAYGYRGLFERKEAFLKPIVPALRNAIEVMQRYHEGTGFPYLIPLLQGCIPLFEKPAGLSAGFTVTVISFSYMHGIPVDDTGNGGGFVFDCRALPNPHHDEILRPYTGKDLVIREWLGRQPEVETFLEQCESLVMASVRNYLQRGFTHLQVAFGCTGGKHRSVYCAEELSRRIIEISGEVTLRLIHQNL